MMRRKTLLCVTLLIAGLCLVSLKSFATEVNSPCQTDTAKYCADATGGLAIKLCLKKNKDKLSPECLKEIDPPAEPSNNTDPDCDDKDKKQEKPVEAPEDCEPDMGFEEVKS